MTLSPEEARAELEWRNALNSAFIWHAIAGAIYAVQAVLNHPDAPRLESLWRLGELDIRIFAARVAYIRNKRGTIDWDEPVAAAFLLPLPKPKRGFQPGELAILKHRDA